MPAAASSSAAAAAAYSSDTAAATVAASVAVVAYQEDVVIIVVGVTAVVVAAAVADVLGRDRRAQGVLAACTNWKTRQRVSVAEQYEHEHKWTSINHWFTDFTQ